MAVLVEGISVVVKRKVIEEKISGGWGIFQTLVPDQTQKLSSDGELVSVSFKTSLEVEKFCTTLTQAGLVFTVDGISCDFAVVGMDLGPTTKTPWLEFLCKSEERKLSFCWLFEGERDKGMGVFLPDLSMDIAVPADWNYETSLTANNIFTPPNTNLKKIDDLIEKGVALHQQGKSGEAIDIFLDAVELGSRNARFILGCMYCNGEGVEQNFEIGRKWLSQAADLGHEMAQKFLSRLP